MRLLHWLAVASIALGVSACDVDNDCSKTEQKTILIPTPADPPLQLRIEQCRVDKDACLDLCTLAGERANLTSSPETCDVAFHGETEVEVKIAFEEFTGGNGCAVAEPGMGGVDF